MRSRRLCRFARLLRRCYDGEHNRAASQPKPLINGHSFCNVKGYIRPVTQFEALLPTESWRGDYLQQGCGGLCGKADLNLDDPSRTSGYQAPYAPLQNGELVVAADDQGEAPSNGDALWARNDLRLRAVFGYSSEHQLARAMKAVVRAFYGRKPTYSYFSGVSDGGREALVLAQRYPADFDGIIARAPANNWEPLAGLVGPWVAAANRNAQGGQILTAEKLPALDAAVMAACADENGVIKDPRACTFDPASMRCPEGSDQPNCLTDEQVRVVRDEYRGPTTKTAMACSTVESLMDPNWPGPVGSSCRRLTLRRPLTAMRRGSVSLISMKWLSCPTMRAGTRWGPCRSRFRCTSSSSNSAEFTTRQTRT